MSWVVVEAGKYMATATDDRVKAYKTYVNDMPRRFDDR